MTANARSKAPKKATSAAAWKKSTAPEPLEMPSGNWMSFRKVGMQTLMATGMMPNSLMAIAQKAVAKGKGEQAGFSDGDLADLLADEKKILEISSFMDKIMIFLAVEPKVHEIPLDDKGEALDIDTRDPELLYVDEVGEEDKQFLFNVVAGGTRDLETFRREHGASMDIVRGLQAVESPAE